MNEHRKKSVRGRILIAAIALPLLYILSSGPMLALGYSSHHCHYTTWGDGSGAVGASVDVDFDPGPWWPVVYSPLLWTAQQPWGDPLLSYWELFPPISQTPDKPE